jgi:hypothetical protein
MSIRTLWTFWPRKSWNGWNGKLWFPFTKGVKSMEHREVDALVDALVARLFVPEALPMRFYAKDFSTLTGARRLSLSSCLNALVAMGIVEKGEKEGNATVYRRLL